MRFFLAGLLILVLPTAAWAQARGQVLDVGFDGRYRPDCWTPMLVQLQSQSADPVACQIQVVQEDLDRDHVTYTQLETLGGNVEGSPATMESFWVYFRPKPTDGGLPDARDTSATLQTLNSELKVLLCDRKGTPFATLPMTQTVQNIDPARSIGDSSRSERLILFVSDGNDSPQVPFDETARGILQDIEAVGVTPRDLPANVIGYEGVDTIVWMDADANFLISGTRTPVLEAIRQWVRQGGHLVICQPPEPHKIEPFADMLPVGGLLNGQWAIPMVDRTDMAVLRRLSLPGDLPWPDKMGPFKVARVPALRGAKVDEWMEWDDGAATSYTPWLARRGVGLGAVTWVAQDLGSQALTREGRTGWRYIWDRVLDWNNPTDVPENYKPQDERTDRWLAAPKADLGKVFEKNGMDFTGRAAALLSIACLAFVVYWVVAGPGTYLFLVAKKRAHLSWFLFGLSAVVATVLTALLVKLVVRGPPELRHISFVRYAVGEANGVVDSRFGLYIPQDGPQQIKLGDPAPHEVSYIAPFSIHPEYEDTSEALPEYLEYQIPVPNAADADAVMATIPYRSTSKKFQLHWVGPMKGTIETAPDMPDIKINAEGNLTGILVNHTGYDLWHIFLAYKRPANPPTSTPSARDKDILIYVEKWPKDAFLTLDDLTGSLKNTLWLVGDNQRRPLGKDTTFGEIDWNAQNGGMRNESTWTAYWHERGGNVGTDADNALPMLMLFDRLSPWIADDQGHRYELFRRGARNLDLSAALSAGELLVGARSMVDGDVEKTPLAAPLSVQDVPLAGTGTTFYEFVLPLDRSAAYAAPTTRPISR